MPIPFSIKYTAEVTEILEPKRYPEVLEYIKQFVIDKTAEDVVIEDNTLRFKVSFFRFGSNWNIMVPIERGKFELIEKNNRVTVSYEFFMYHMFIFTTVIATIAGITSEKPLVGVFAFFWLCGMNWIIALVRHKSMLNEIAGGIDILLILQKDPQTSV